MLKLNIDDGCNSELVETAMFEGILEIPVIKPCNEDVIPAKMIPFSKLSKTENYSELVVCYEPDVLFGELVKQPELYVDKLARFCGIASPDCSLYRDMPLIAQFINVYRNRAVGSFLQKHNINVITNIRWGDERSYTTNVLPEKVAFLGAPHNSIVSVGTYGCFRGKENKYYFEAGFEAMLEELTPKVVLIYGTKPKNIFAKYEKYVKLINYPDWITYKHKGDPNGNK